MQVEQTYQVALIDESLVSHTGLSCLINDLQHFSIVDQHFSQHVNQIDSIKADVLLYSSKLIDLNSIRLIENIMLRNKELPIVVLAPGINEEDQFNLINIGIGAIIIDDASSCSLKEALFCVINHGSYLPITIVESLKENSQLLKHRHLIKAAFSELQIKILQLLASGLISSKVADKLCKSPRTIEWHKEQMMKTINVSSTTQLLLFALEYGLIDSPFSYNNYDQPVSEVKEREQFYLS